MATILAPSEPAAIWSTTRQMVFDKTNLSISQNVILSHGRFALSTMINKIDFLYSIVGPDLQKNAIYYHPEIPETLTEICLHQGIASDIMFNDSERSFKESAYAYKMRIERCNYTKRICSQAGVPHAILANRILRNQLIHIDDHLAKAMRKPNTGWFIDMAVSHRDQFNAPNGLQIGFCRSLIVSEEIILHLGNEISLRGLRREAGAVLETVFGNPPLPPLP